jgi:hypothetical protein
MSSMIEIETTIPILRRHHCAFIDFREKEVDEIREGHACETCEDTGLFEA